MGPGCKLLLRICTGTMHVTVDLSQTNTGLQALDDAIDHWQLHLDLPGKLMEMLQLHLKICTATMQIMFDLTDTDTDTGGPQGPMQEAFGTKQMMSASSGKRMLLRLGICQAV